MAGRGWGSWGATGVTWPPPPDLTPTHWQNKLHSFYEKPGSAPGSVRSHAPPAPPIAPFPPPSSPSELSGGGRGQDQSTSIEGSLPKVLVASEAHPFEESRICVTCRARAPNRSPLRKGLRPPGWASGALPSARCPPAPRTAGAGPAASCPSLPPAEGPCPPGTPPTLLTPPPPAGSGWSWRTGEGLSHGRHHSHAQCPRASTWQVLWGLGDVQEAWRGWGRAAVALRVWKEGPQAHLSPPRPLPQGAVP